MPGAKNFPPELKRRNRLTLLAFLGVIVLLALTPLILRLLTRPIPTLSDSARDLFPDKAGVTSGITLYAAAEAELTAAVGDMLVNYPFAVQAVFPEAAKPIEIALLDDEVQVRQVWIQVFGRDDRRPGVRGVGRATFVLYETRVPAPIEVRAQAAEVAHFIGRALLEQKLEERLRLVPEAYAWLVGEMMAVALMPELVEQAWREYEQLRQSAEPMTEKGWLGAFAAEPGAMARVTTRLIAAEFISSRRSHEMVALIRDGYDVETAFRAVASGLVTSEAQADNTPPQSVPGTSFDAMVERLEGKLVSRRARAGGGN